MFRVGLCFITTISDCMTCTENKNYASLCNEYRPFYTFIRSEHKSHHLLHEETISVNTLANTMKNKSKSNIKCSKQTFFQSPLLTGKKLTCGVWSSNSWYSEHQWISVHCRP